MKFEIFAIKIKMAKIFRVLLLALFFCLPSGNDGGVSPPQLSKDISPAEQFCIWLLDDYISSGCKAAYDPMTGTRADAIMKDKECSAGDRHIIELLVYYFTSDCKAFDADANDAAMQGPGYSTGEKSIIKLLVSYFSSGCEAAKAVGAEVGTTQSPGYSTGEKNIIDMLLGHFSSSECKGPDTSQPKKQNPDLSKPNKQNPDLSKSGEPAGTNDTAPNGNPKGDVPSPAGSHRQSIVLELFLLIFGVRLTRIDL